MSGDRTYHVPAGRFYDRVRIEAEKGARRFFSEGEARAAEWWRSSR